VKKIIGLLVVLTVAALAYYVSRNKIKPTEVVPVNQKSPSPARTGPKVHPRATPFQKSKEVPGPIAQKHLLTLTLNGQELFFKSSVFKNETIQKVPQGSYAISSFGPLGWSTDVLHMSTEDCTFTPDPKPEPEQKTWFQAKGSPSGQGLYTGSSSGAETVSWEKSVSDEFTSSPVCDDRFLYVTGKSGKIYCRMLKTGDSVWKKSIASDLSLPPLLWKNFVFAATPSGKIIPLKKKGGKILNFFPCESNILGLSIQHNQMIAWTSAGDIFSLQLKETTFKGIRISQNWRLNVLEQSSVTKELYLSEGSTPVINSRTTFFQSNGGLTFAVSLTGKLLWAKNLQKEHSRKEDYLKDSGGQVTLRMAGDEEDRFVPMPAVSGDKLFVGVGAQLICLNANTGDTIWQSSTGSRISSSVSTAYGLVLVGTQQGTLAARTTEEGFSVYDAVLSKFPIVVAPVINRTRVFTGDLKGQIYTVHTFLGQKQNQLLLHATLAPMSPSMSGQGMCIPGKYGKVWNLK
jgi:outer membrane protein assembly factor BamB